MVSRGDFVYHGDHLTYPQGKVLLSCVGALFSNGLAPTSTWRASRIVRPVPSRTPASRRDRSDGTSASRCITPSI